MALLKHMSAAPLSLGAPERPSSRLCLSGCLRTAGATPAALPPSAAAVSVGATRQPSVPSTRPPLCSPPRPPACSQLLAGPPVAAAPGGVLSCVRGARQASVPVVSAAPGLISPHLRRDVRVPRSPLLPFSHSPQLPQSAATPKKADFSSHAAVSNFLMRRYQIAQINLEPMNAPASGTEIQSVSV